jgi:CSLREA domain-containing protein
MRKALALVAICAGAVLALGPASAGAATITVNTNGDDAAAAVDDGDCTLREAISAANTDADVDACDNGDTALVDTIVFSGVTTAIILDEDVPFSNENANLEGDLDILAGAAGLTIEGGAGPIVVVAINGGTPAERIFDRVSGAGTVELRNLGISGGTDTVGGGILNRTGPLEVEESVVSQNTVNSGSGGGISTQAGTTLIVDDTDVTNNTVTGGGGAGIDSAGTLTVRNGSNIDANSALGAGGNGGGILVGLGSLTVTSSSISLNNADAFGGGISFLSSGALSITNGVIDANNAGGSAVGGGGGIQVTNAVNTTIDDSRISDNSAGLLTGAARPGGGIDFNSTAGGLQVTDTVMNENDSTGSGAGIAVRASGLNLARSVITTNHIQAPANVDVRGGGISMTGTSIGVADSNVSGNTVLATGTGRGEAGGVQVAGSATSTITKSTFSGNTAAGGNPHTGGGLLIQSNTNLTNVTVSGNNAAGAFGDGGGLATAGTPAVNVNNSTFAANIADLLPKGISEGTNAFALRFSIVDDGCSSGPVDTDGGGNVVDGASCGAGMNVGDPMLLPLRDNGGPGVGRPGDLRAIPMHDLDPASPAVDFVSGNCTDHISANVTVDQRGLPRPFDGDAAGGVDCDAGAYELNEQCQGIGVTQATATSAEDTLVGDQGGLVDRRDVFNGLGGDDLVLGVDLGDVLCGGTENDTIAGGAGDDVVDGGAGSDALNYSSAVTANLTTGLATGEGTDTPIVGIENLGGSPQNDNLTGEAGVNVISGGGGDDVISGGGGVGPDLNDILNGDASGAAGDTVSYSTRNDAIGVDLSPAGSDTGGDLVGPESDTLNGFENATGGSAGDTLTGDGTVNALRGLAGNDTVTGLAAADFLFLGADNDIATAQDGVADTIDCTGGGTDTGTFDTSPAENYVGCDGDGDGVQNFFDACPTQSGTLANGCPDPAATPTGGGTATTPTTPKKCKKGFKLKKGKCKKKKRK